MIDGFLLHGLLGIFALLPMGTAVNRVYYIAAVEREWDYAPSSENLINPEKQRDADTYIRRGTNRIGRKYLKTLYRQYTDATYSTEIPTPSWLGLYGPIIRAEVGDNITVHFRNNGRREFSMHPHGFFYLKDSEGALYVDGTSGRFKFDDIVMPGTEVTLTWLVDPDDAPGQNDPACIPYVYHSHVDTPPDTNTGLIGVISLCKPGTLNSRGERKDVDHEFFLIAKVFDENASWLTSVNLKKCGRPRRCKKLLEAEDEEFMESNLMHSLNGYVFGNLPGLEVCSGDKIAWHVIGMGNEIDIHSIEFYGQLLHTEMMTDDNVQVFPAVFKTGMMTARNEGEYLISCVVTDHNAGGMNAFFTVENCGRPPPQGNGITRRYCLAIEEGEWDYGPSGLDNYNGGSLVAPGSQAEPYFSKSDFRIGGKYEKARFHEYVDATFTTRKTNSDKSLGILGPVIRAEAGDDLEIAVMNEGSRPFSFIGHGLSYTPEVNGLLEEVDPGDTFIYKFHVPDDVIGPKDPDCIVKLYYSPEISDVNSGLIGPLLLCRKGAIDANTGRQKCMTKEFFLLFSAFDENLSWYLDENIQQYSDPTKVNTNDADFIESNIMRGINGRSFGNLEGLNMEIGDNITWHVFSYGDEANVQSPYFHGNAFSTSLSGVHRDVSTLISSETHSLLMVPDNPGTWPVVSATNTMLDRGVTALYTVEKCPTEKHKIYSGGITRIYNIGIIETEWDYAPNETSLITGRDLNDPRADFIFVRDDELFIGDTYKKALYREYTNNTFTCQKSRDKDNIHLEIMGPLIKAEVGDKIKINLKNMADRKYSIHPHGLFYTKSSQGTEYNDGQDAGVLPGQTRTYIWEVPERAGPGSDDPNCIPWLYTSAIDPTKDVYSGLIGSIVICRKGILDANNKRTDVDREFALLFHIFDENRSWYISDNIARHAPARVGTNYADDPEFEESNLLHAINGRLSGNVEGLVMKLNNTVAWYLLSAGSELDLHTVHFHGQTFTHVSNSERRTDVLEVFPGAAEEVEMVAHNVGNWILHCHVLDHISAGMETLFTVLA